MWEDPENRHPDGSLVVSPVVEGLLLTHDSIGPLQFPAERLAWAKAKLREWLNNEVEIAGTRLVIPWSGHVGASWGEKGESL